MIFVDEKMAIDSHMSLAGENANMTKEKKPDIAENKLMTSVARSTSYYIVLQVRISLLFHSLFFLLITAYFSIIILDMVYKFYLPSSTYFFHDHGC